MKRILTGGRALRSCVSARLAGLAVIVVVAPILVDCVALVAISFPFTPLIMAFGTVWLCFRGLLYCRKHLLRRAEVQRHDCWLQHIYHLNRSDPQYDLLIVYRHNTQKVAFMGSLNAEEATEVVYLPPPEDWAVLFPAWVSEKRARIIAVLLAEHTVLACSTGIYLAAPDCMEFNARLSTMSEVEVPGQPASLWHEESITCGILYFVYTRLNFEWKLYAELHCDPWFGRSIDGEYLDVSAGEKVVLIPLKARERALDLLAEHCRRRRQRVLITKTFAPHSSATSRRRTELRLLYRAPIEGNLSGNSL